MVNAFGISILNVLQGSPFDWKLCLVVNSRILYNLLKPEGVNNVEPSHFGRLKKGLCRQSAVQKLCVHMVHPFMKKASLKIRV